MKDLSPYKLHPTSKKEVGIGSKRQIWCHLFNSSSISSSTMARPALFGAELPELKFDGVNYTSIYLTSSIKYFFLKFKFLDWFVHVEDPRPHWDVEPTYLIAQFAFLFGGICTFIHGKIKP